MSLPSGLSDPRTFVFRYLSALRIQRREEAGKASKNDRGVLTGTLGLLYAPEENAARDAIKSATAARNDANAHRGSAAESDESGADIVSSVRVAFTALTTTATTASALKPAAAKFVAVKAAATSSLHPQELARECGVCYSEFNHRTPPADDDQPPIVLRVRMRLCGHAAICSDCFTTYLESRIRSDDCMPFLPCPDADCRLPLSHVDIVSPTPTPAIVEEFEDGFKRTQERIAHRNNAAWNAMHADAIGRIGEADNKNTHKGKRAKRRSSGSQRGKDGDSTGSEEEGNDTPATRAAVSSAVAPAPSSNDTSDSIVPIAPFLSSSSSSPASSSSPPAPLLSTGLLAQLVILHMQKLLRRRPDWLPCGTFATQKDTANEKSHADAESNATEATSCPFGFMLTPGQRRAQGSAPKLKKCDHCNLLQPLHAPAESTDSGVGDGLSSLLADGTMRPCPVCSALHLKDYGMCNILQCYSCQIWWNWSSGESGQSQSSLKNRARSEGTLWEPGEFAFQYQLERKDPEAFKALLARNGIEYNPNYIRGHSN